MLRRGSGSRRRVRLGLAAALLAAAGAAGCERIGTARAGTAGPLTVEKFNLAHVRNVPLNARLVFVFSGEIDPRTVNSDTIRIWTIIRGERREAAGTFWPAGRTVSWYPDMTSRTYPIQTHGRARHDAEEPLLDDDAGLNTTPIGLTYHVLIPSLPELNTVKSTSGKAVRHPYTAEFETMKGVDVMARRTVPPLAGLFAAEAPASRRSIRVLETLAYDGRGSLFGAALGYKDWILDPTRTAGENPLHLNPALLAQARARWQGQEASGEYVDQTFGVELLPRLTDGELGRSAFPAGLTHPDERLVSNLHGRQVGRPRPVTGLSLYFGRAVSPDTFLDGQNNPRDFDDCPVQVRVLAEPAQRPESVAPEPYTLTFTNHTELRNGERRSAHLALTFARPIRHGWLHLTIDPDRVRGMAGEDLEPNLDDRFVFLWPVRINAP